MYLVSVCPGQRPAWPTGCLTIRILPLEEALGIRVLDRTGKGINELKMVHLLRCSTACRKGLPYKYAGAYCASGGCRCCSHHMQTS